MYPNSKAGGSRMSSAERMDVLRSRHAGLEAEIDGENQRPHPDEIRLAELKREKLRLKEQIEGIRPVN